MSEPINYRVPAAIETQKQQLMTDMRNLKKACQEFGVPVYCSFGLLTTEDAATYSFAGYGCSSGERADLSKILGRLLAQAERHYPGVVQEAVSRSRNALVIDEGRIDG